MLLLYSPALVLAIWSTVWSLGWTGNLVIVIGLTATATAVVLHCFAEFGRRKNGGPHGR
jgi:Kef-type K+ transport system membrane component KefB